MSLNILSIGASRNIGYFTALYLLGEGHRVTFLLRKPSVFDNDADIQTHVKSGKAKLVAGDALQAGDVKKAWAAASGSGNVDFVVYTVGMTPKITLTGLHFDHMSLCTTSMHALLSTWPRNAEGASSTKLIAISSNGVTPKSRKEVPWLLRSTIYGPMLHIPHLDKRAMEQNIAYCAAGSDAFECSSQEITKLEKSGHLASNWQDGLHKGDWLEACILRPSLFTSGESKCETQGVSALRVDTAELSSAWFISRKDIAWLIAKKMTKEWDEWKGKAVTLSY